MYNCGGPPAYSWLMGRFKNIKTSKITMKTIAILALTAAALVSCQQQQQQKPVEPTPAPAPVETVKGK